MYSLEELKTLGFLILAAILGRLLFYRQIVLDGSFRQKFKIRCLQWLWELPVISVVALLAFEVIAQFDLNEHTGLVVAVGIGFIGVNTFKIWVEDWLDSKFRANMKRRRDSSDDQS